MEALAERCMADYDEDGWKDPAYRDGSDVSVLGKLVSRHNPSVGCDAAACAGCRPSRSTSVCHSTRPDVARQRRD